MAEDEREGIPIVGWAGSSQVAPIYSNNLDLHWTLTDVTVRFGEISHRRETNDAQVREKALITFPWWQAKVLKDMLTDLIDRYERANGEIRPVKLP